MQRDNFKCRDCGDSKSNLQVHHCFYAKGEPWETPNAFLLTVCNNCHETRGELESDTKRMIGAVMARLNHTELYIFASGLSKFVDSDSDLPRVLGLGEIGEMVDRRDEGEIIKA